jgi:hypothetical protein
MLNAAMVMMILAGLFGLPAVLCSAAWYGISHSDGSGEPAPLMSTMLFVSTVASIGSIIAGSLVKRLGKIKAGVSAIVLALMFSSLVLGLNPLGWLSGTLLFIAAVMIFVAPQEQFRDTVRVEVAQQRVP